MARRTDTEISFSFFVAPSPFVRRGRRRRHKKGRVDKINNSLLLLFLLLSPNHQTTWVAQQQPSDRQTDGDGPRLSYRTSVTLSPFFLLYRTHFSGTQNLGKAAIYNVLYMHSKGYLLKTDKG